MKVGELIEELKKLDPNMEVYLYDGEYGADYDTSLERVSVMKVDEQTSTVRKFQEDVVVIYQW